LVILSASHGNVPPGKRGKRLEEMLEAERSAILSASPRGKLVRLSGSGHMVQDDKPEVVVSTIREVVEQVRARSPSRH
jgi:pimeloyl-ACP methyl ester carboxylesterase